MDLEKLKYPIGKFDLEKKISDNDLPALMLEISLFPSKLSDTIKKLNPTQLNTPYRLGGWTPKQVVAHLADSHMNAHIRFLMALTENNPIIKPYQEQLVAALPFVDQMPVSVSFDVVSAVHTRWFFLLQSMQSSDFDKTYMHPQYNRNYSLRQALASYVWHGQHHLAHIHLVI